MVELVTLSICSSSSSLHKTTSIHNSHLMFIKTFLATFLLAQSLYDCAKLMTGSEALKQQQQQNNHHMQQHLKTNMQHQHSSQASSSASTQNQSSARPIDRPSLSLVASAANDRESNRNSTFGKSSTAPLLEAPIDWFIMGGENDLQTEEGKNAPSVVEFSSGGRNLTSRRSSGNSKRGRQSGKSSNTTVFDDEQSPDSSDSNEIFDDAEESSSLSGNQKEPECAANGRYYCTYKEDYPLKLVTEVTKYYKWPLEKLFRDLHAQIMPKLAQDTTGNLVCDSITRVVRPGWTRNTNDRWLVVINTENYHQYVTEVVCQYGSNSRCNFIPPCYYSSCQQRYNTQKLLVIDPSNPYRGPFLSEFLFPSCCVCYVPSASDTFKDNYRSSPATIYQRTFQQEAANNLYPPQFRPPGLMDEAQASIVDQSMKLATGVSPSSLVAGGRKLSGPQQTPSSQPLGPGEIRREGDQYKRYADSSSLSSESQRREGGHSASDLRDFPRLGMSDSLIDQRPTGAASSVVDTKA